MNRTMRFMLVIHMIDQLNERELRAFINWCARQRTTAKRSNP